MTRWIVLLSLLPAAVGGCGVQATVLRAERGYLLTTEDVLVRPEEQTDLRAQLRSGDLLGDVAGAVVRFRRADGRLYRAAETGAGGVAVVAYTPDAAGDYPFTVDVSPNGLPEPPPDPWTLLVACRRADEPMMIVDLDKTLVASGFDEVLLGDAEPMPESPRVMDRLAERYATVYLTHRPGDLGPKSKGWLREQGFPQGPLLMSDFRGLLAGSGRFKSGRLKDLTERFSRIELGIGDKVSDVKAYADNGIEGILIIHPDEYEDPAELSDLADEIESLGDRIHVVTAWTQIERIVFNGADHPPADMARRLRRMAETRPARTRPSEERKGD
jgi:hypothetical protein